MKPVKEKVSITLDWDLLKKTRELAENCDRSLSQYINIVLKEHVKQTEATHTDTVADYTGHLS